MRLLPFAFFVLKLSVSGILLMASIAYPSEAISLSEIASPLHQRDIDPCVDPVNPVVAENCQPGTDEWIVLERGNIEGFAYPSSVNKGESVHFYINSDANRVNLDIFRIGYYQGKGGRLVLSAADVANREQPACHHDRETGLTSCNNWHESFLLDVLQEWVSGVYAAKMVREDDGGANYALFVVRDDERPADILYQQSLFTYHAYNNYGGKSVYTFNSGCCDTETTHPRGSKVSLFRPFSGAMGIRGNAANNFFRVEFPMVRWLEAQGYDVTYSTTLDTHLSGTEGNPNRLLDHRAFLSVGHDEYWTQEMRDAITAARDGGVHQGIFSANTMYWRVRLEADPWTGEPNSVIVTYKTTEDGPSDPSGHPTGTWRDPDGVNDPENGVLGAQYIGDNDELYFPLRVTAEQGVDRIYRHTDLQTMPPDTYINFGDQTVGWEWNAVVDNGHSPQNIEILASSPVFGLQLHDAGNYTNADSDYATTHITRYTTPDGTIVFSCGTIQWSWGLGAKGTEVIEPDRYVPQITYNVLADMGVQPNTPDDTLIVDGENGIIASPPEAFLPLETEDLPAISNIELDTIDGLMETGRTVTITWETNSETKGQVLLGDRTGHVYEPAGQHEDYLHQHSITITGQDMRPYHTYFYKIVAVDRAGHIVASEEMHFKTAFNPIVTAGMVAKDTYQSLDCWAQANPTLAAGVSVVAAIALAFCGWNMIRVLRRWRHKRKIIHKES